MDNNSIRELAALMKEMGLTSLAYRNGAESIKITRPAEEMFNALSMGVAAKKANAPESYIVDEPVSGNAFTVKSPMVGVFYCAPGVDEAPYVTVGDTVMTGDVLCVVEAMKIMNEITAERDGVISEICVENKDVVEYGQPLFRIRDSF